MNWFPRCIGALLLALWLPATMHCDLEHLPGFAFLQTCCTAEGKGCADPAQPPDACAEFEAALYKTEEPITLPAAPVVCLASPEWLVFQEPTLPPRAALALPAATPPEMPRPRPLDLRASPPARAPARLA